MRLIKPALLYFGWVFGAGFVLGAIRVPLLVPRLGERYAELLEMPLMLVVIVVAARWLQQRFALTGKRLMSAAIGLLALALLLFAELLLIVVMQQRSLAEYIASRDPVSGTVYLLMLVFYAALPAILAGRTRR